LTRITLICALAVALALPASGAAGSSRTAGGSQTYEDSTGELPGGPDISSVTVSNDARGLVTIQIAIPDRPTMTPGMGVVVFFNTDRNLATGAGDDDGAEYAIGYSGGVASLGKWNGSDFSFDAPQDSLLSGYANGVATLKISLADLGGTKAFDFWTDAFDGDPSSAPRDYAPDLGHSDWTYTASIAPPAKASPAKKPAKAKTKAKTKTKTKTKTKKSGH
jgi:hypothetical protein